MILQSDHQMNRGERDKPSKSDIADLCATPQREVPQND